MAFLLGLDKASIEYPHKKLFSGLSLGVNDGDCIGIVGKNGDGKSTLLRLLAQRIQADSGRQIISSGIELAYLGQRDDFCDEDSVGKTIVGDIPEYQWASDPKIRSILQALVVDLDWDTPVGKLSGGQRQRVNLARVLISSAEVLLLDEPTNHLDIQAIHWLAHHLQKRILQDLRALLLVTHDRWFLDEVCTNMWEVHDGKVESFEGGYSAYMLKRVERAELEARMEAKKRNLMRKELAWLSRGAQARSTKPKFHLKKAQELIAHEPAPRNSLELKTSAISRLGKQVIEFKKLRFSYDDSPSSPELFHNIDFIIGPGDRIGFVGPNGIGKSSLFKLIQKELTPSSGSINLGKTVKIAALSQELSELKEFENSRVKDLLAEYKTSYQLGDELLSPVQLLERLDFDTKQLMSYVRDLSGGQRRRLQLMLTLLDRPNVLLLDEPGNDLDTDMLTILEDCLDSWPGTLLMISHDRYLMERVCDDLYSLREGKLYHLPGGIEEYLESLAEQAGDLGTQGIRPAASKTQDQATESVKETGAAEASAINKISPAELRLIKKERDSLERKMQTAQGRVKEAKELLSQLDPSNYEALMAQQAEIDEKQATLDELEFQWLEVMAKLEGV